MRSPSEADIQAAKAYIIERISAEHAMSYQLEQAMRDAAERIVAICYSVRVNPQNFRYSDLPIMAQFDIDTVIGELQEAIDDYFQTFAIADHEEDRDAILPIILGENNGATFEDRLSDYCEKYKNELMVLIGAGLYLGIKQSALVKSIGENLKHPYANQMLTEGIDSPLSYGRGRTNSMFTAIDSLTQYGIAQGWMRHWELKTTANGAIGWIVQRGSSYQCDICDDNCGFHSIDEGTGLPRHSHCCCLAVPVYT